MRRLHGWCGRWLLGRLFGSHPRSVPCRLSSSLISGGVLRGGLLIREPCGFCALYQQDFGILLKYPHQHAFIIGNAYKCFVLFNYGICLLKTLSEYNAHERWRGAGS